jgi:spermidine synthase
VVTIVRRLQAVFPIVRPLGTYVPLYGSYWAFAIASRDRDPCAIDEAQLRERMAARAIDGLRLYHPALHAALFTLPAYFAERVA